MNEDDYAMQVGMGAGYRRTVRSLRVTLTLSTREGETRRRKGRLRARTHLTTQNLEDLRRRRKPETRRPMIEAAVPQGEAKRRRLQQQHPIPSHLLTPSP